MTLRTSIHLSAASAALAAVLVIAPAASASSNGEGFVLRRSAPNVVLPHGVHRDAQRAIPQSTDWPVQAAPLVAGVPAVPDRIDRIGTGHGPQVVQVPLAEDGQGFDWSNAAIGAAFLLGALLLVVFAVMSGGRRRGGLAMPS
jgi:hypothetical protein